MLRGEKRRKKRKEVSYGRESLVVMRILVPVTNSSWRSRNVPSMSLCLPFRFRETLQASFQLVADRKKQTKQIPILCQSSIRIVRAVVGSASRLVAPNSFHYSLAAACCRFRHLFTFNYKTVILFLISPFLTWRFETAATCQYNAKLFSLLYISFQVDDEEVHRKACLIDIISIL